jgi:hypothetical protein
VTSIGINVKIPENKIYEIYSVIFFQRISTSFRKIVMPEIVTGKGTKGLPSICHQQDFFPRLCIR